MPRPIENDWIDEPLMERFRRRDHSAFPTASDHISKAASKLTARDAAKSRAIAKTKQGMRNRRHKHGG